VTRKVRRAGVHGPRHHDRARPARRAPGREAPGSVRPDADRAVTARGHFPATTRSSTATA